MKGQGIDMKSKKMCQFKGVPPYHLPRWRYLPLQNKLPMLKKVPEGAVNLYLGNGNIGNAPWIKNKNLDFDLWDPKMMKLPCEMEYDSLRDPYLKCYFANSTRLKTLYRQGLITREGKTITNLKTYNKYRSYLHNMNLDILKTMQIQTEYQDVNNAVLKTMVRKKKEESERMKEATECDDFPLSIRYSDILRDEMKGICDQAEFDFKQTSYFRAFPEGERDVLIKFRQLLLSHVKKKALIRLRKLQIYEDNQSTFWNDWMKHTQAEIQSRADELVKEQVYRYEKCKHIGQYNELTANRRANLNEAVLNARQEHQRKQMNMIRNVRQNICRISHRQYPLSAICPYNFFDGGNWETPCPYQEIVTTIKDQLYCEEIVENEEMTKEETLKLNEIRQAEKAPKSICAPKEKEVRDCNGKIVDARIQNATVADRLVKEVIKNSLALTVKHLKLPILCSDISKQSQFKIIRNTYFVQEMMTGIKDELANLLRNNLELLKKIVQSNNKLKDKQRKSIKKQQNQDEEIEETLWVDAPLMKSNSNTMVGRYVREQLLQVAIKLKNDGSTKNNKSQSQDSKLDQKFQNAIGEVTMARDLHEMACQLIDGKKMICQSLEIITIFEENEEDEDEDENEEEEEEEEKEKKTKKCDRKLKDDLVYNLLTSMIRSTLLIIRDSISCNAIDTEDIYSLCAIISKESGGSSKKIMCKEVERLIDEYSENLMKNRCMNMLIKETAQKVRCTKENPKSDEEISKSILNATRKFVTKVVENIIAEVKVSKVTEESDSEEIEDDEIICGENESEECLQECAEVDDACLEEEEPDEISVIPNADLSGSDKANEALTPDCEDTTSQLVSPTKTCNTGSSSDKHYKTQTPDSISKMMSGNDSADPRQTPDTPAPLTDDTDNKETNNLEDIENNNLSSTKAKETNESEAEDATEEKSKNTEINKSEVHEDKTANYEEEGASAEYGEETDEEYDAEFAEESDGESAAEETYGKSAAEETDGEAAVEETVGEAAKENIEIIAEVTEVVFFEAAEKGSTEVVEE